MSTRHIKKVYGSDIPLKDDDNTSNTEIVVVNNNSKSFNMFNLLNQSAISDNEAQDIEDDQENDREDNKEEEESVPNNTYYNNTKRKNRRKKKTKKSEDVKQHESCDKNADEIERCIWEVNQLLGEPVASSSNQVLEPQWVNKPKENILIVQHKYLNPYNESKKIFGNKAIQVEQSKIQGKNRSGYKKKTWLVFSPHNWPSLSKSGLSMSIDNSIEGTENVQYFVYQHNSSYRHIQSEFFKAVESFNPENIIAITNAHPYHVDGLLQLSDTCRLNEDLSMAAYYIERALYSLENAFHTSFNLTTTKCRLDYRKQQNRALFVALFKHIRFIGGRACYRTCLEFCKLLLSLDPKGDPLAVVLFIDFYALKAKEYQWFVEFCDLWESSRNLTQLPNIAYSLALAHFHLDTETDVADELLQNALIMFPGVLMMLLEKCGIQTDPKVMNHSFFNFKQQAKTSSALQKLQKLYVTCSYYLWKTADVLPWLEKCVHIVIDRIESKDDYVQYCEVRRKKRYQGRLPRNILRHIFLAEMTVDGEEVQNEEILSYDPFPPVDSIDIYKKISRREVPTASSSNLLSLFFSSLFTDMNEGHNANAE